MPTDDEHKQGYMGPPVKAVRYSYRELIECEIADLEIDLKCAMRDGLVDYANDVKDRLLAKIKERENASDD